MWSLATFVAARSLTFVSMLVLARLLDPATFGVLAAVLAYVTFLELTTDLGMKATVVYESEEGITPRVQTAFTLNLTLAVVLAGVGGRGRAARRRALPRRGPGRPVQTRGAERRPRRLWVTCMTRSCSAAWSSAGASSLS